MDLTICMEISLNPGPNIDQNNESMNQSKIPVLISSRFSYSNSRRTSIAVASNLVQIPLTEQSSYNTGKHLRLCYLNARSLKNKSAHFVCYASSTGADIFAITETWFTEDDMTHRAEITLPGYKLLDHPRVGRTGGGIALLFREKSKQKESIAVNVNRLSFLNGYYSTAQQNCG